MSILAARPKEDKQNNDEKRQGRILIKMAILQR
jgi:hypothetical protein